MDHIRIASSERNRGHGPMTLRAAARAFSSDAVRVVPAAHAHAARAKGRSATTGRGRMDRAARMRKNVRKSTAMAAARYEHQTNCDLLSVPVQMPCAVAPTN